MIKFKPRSPFNLVITGLMLTSLLFGGVLTPPVVEAQAGPTQTTKSPGNAGRDEKTSSPHKSPSKLKGAVVDNRLSKNVGLVHVMVELEDEPAALVYANNNEKFGLNSAQSGQSVRQQLNTIEKAQQTLLPSLTSSSIKAQVLYQVQNSYNGIAIIVDSNNIEQIANLKGVKSIRPLVAKTRDNASSVALIGAPAVWTSYGITGTNVRVGIIDTGIDYLHTNFGGPGTYAGYNDTVITDTPGIFPGAKVAGGIDLAGNDYNATKSSPAYQPIPHPDPDPLDCASALGGGHGSHVAGTTGGYGVNSDGTTFKGPWDNTVPFNSLRIGPGVAPGAKLYAIRVFGCDGSTDLVEKAIDWALDPNGDGNFADHLDVVNMSLGSDFGTPYDTSAVSAENAAKAGVFMSISAGNSGDTYFVSGSPGSAPHALTVASSVDAADVTDGFKVNSPSPIAGIYPGGYSSNFVNEAALPVTAPMYYPSGTDANKTGCTAFAAGEAALISGTILLVDWVPAGAATFPCGSAARANNAAAAGAKGLIIMGNQPYLDTAIAGNALIPAIFTSKTVGNQLKTVVTAGTVSTSTATLSYEYKASVKLVDQTLVDTISDFTSRGPTARSNQLKPDIAAPGQGIFSTNSGTGNKGESLNGTSMAAPHMAGVAALLRQKNPTWTVEEIKAQAMNTAAHDLYTGFGQTGVKYGPARVGAGRVDVPQAISTTVLAYSADDPGAVSVSFGFVEVITPTVSLTRTIKVSNKGNTSASYTLGYTSYTDVPGVAYDFPNGNSITVQANSSANVVIRLTASADAVRHVRDASVAALQNSSEFGQTFPRHWLTEESGLVTLTPTGGAGNGLRVPVHAIVRAASQMSGPSSIAFSGATDSIEIELSGQGILHPDAIPTATRSIVTAFELAASSPLAPLNPKFDPKISRNADLKYVGISTDVAAVLSEGGTVNDSALYFAIATHGDWSTPNAGEVEFDVYIDSDNNPATGNSAGFDYVVYTANLANGQDPTDILYSYVAQYNPATNTFDAINALATNELEPDERDSALFNNNVLVMPVLVADLAPGTNTVIRYQVKSYNREYAEYNIPVDVTEPLIYNLDKPGIDFTFGLLGIPWWPSQPGYTVPAVYNRANYQANKSQGILFLHHFNAQGTRAQAISVSEQGVCATPNIVTNAVDNGGDICGSLSYAIKQANASTTPYTISFSGTTSIAVETPLPAITGTAPITIDGGCSPSGVPSTTIQATVPGIGGLQLKSNGITVKGLHLEGFSDYGLDIQSNNNVITCNAIVNNGVGIRLGTTGGTSADNNKLGSVGNPASGNLVSSNRGAGIVVQKGVGNVSYYTRMGANANAGGGLRVWAGGHLNFGVGNKITP